MSDRFARFVRVLVPMVAVSVVLALAASATAASPIGGPLKYYGGRVVSNIHVVQVLWGADASVGASTPAFYKSLLGSSYLGWLNSDYGTTNPEPWVATTKTNQTIGLGSYDNAGPYTITPSNTQTTLTDADVQAELSAQILAGNLPAPRADAAGNDNTYYAISFPSSVTIELLPSVTSCWSFGAYHGTIADVGGGFGEVYYGVFPDCSAPADAQTNNASHELVETITDPEGGLSSSFPNGSPPDGWFGTFSIGVYEPLPVGPEVSDLCEYFASGRLDGTDDAVALNWSNSANGCVLNLPAPITTSTSQSFTLGVPSAFTIATTDPSMTFASVPLPIFSFMGPPYPLLPDGVSFGDNQDGTASVSGTPLWLGNYQLWVTASNASGVREVKPFILTVNPPSTPGFMAPLTKSTFKAGATIPVKFVLTTADGTPLSSSDSVALASNLRVALAGSGISTQYAACNWVVGDSSYFQCNINTSNTLPTGPTHPYTITAQVSASGGPAAHYNTIVETIPTLGSATNPETIYFK